MIKIAFYNKKGGVGKTTSVLNIAGELVMRGYKVLVIDTDGQGNSTSQLLIENENYKKGSSPTLVDYLEGKVKFNDIIYKALIKTRSNANAKNKGIDVIACDTRIAFTQVDEKKLQNLFHELEKPYGKHKRQRYDIALVDFSPYMGDNTISLFSILNYIVIPVSADCMAQEGMIELKQTLDRIKLNGGNNINILGVFMNDVHLTESYDRWIFEDSKEQLKDLMIPTPIRHSTYAKQSVHFGTPLCWLKKTQDITKDYAEITNYLLNKISISEVKGDK